MKNYEKTKNIKQCLQKTKFQVQESVMRGDGIINP